MPELQLPCLLERAQSEDTLVNADRRRLLVQAALGAASVWAAPLVWAQPSIEGIRAGADADRARLIVVFLRGAYDGLSALVPHADADYYRLRPTIAVPPPDGSEQTTLKLDNTFGLNPALAPLLPLWREGVLAALPCAGSPDPTRSHFDAQRHWETGLPGHSGARAGWMNTLASMLTQGESVDKPTAIGVGEANPLILTGRVPVQRVPKGRAATQQGALGNERTRDAIMRLYSGEDKLSEAFRAGADSRMDTAQMLSAEMRAANNGAGAAQGLLLDARHLGTLMRQDSNLRLGFISAGGWDTHANQGSVNGVLARNLSNLASALVQLRKDFSQPNDVVLVCSEFGRTSFENGTGGTDHGRGNTMWLMGNRVHGGRWHGQWKGLVKHHLHEGRDLPVHHDFRAVLAQVLRATHALQGAQLARLFPGYAWDKSLDGLMKS
nr:DUF1501 domain-containing protein [uncultured Limnobacter sp.]